MSIEAIRFFCLLLSQAFDWFSTHSADLPWLQAGLLLLQLAYPELAPTLELISSAAALGCNWVDGTQPAV